MAIEKATINFIMSVAPSVGIKLEVDIGEFLLNVFDTLKFSLTMDKNNRYFS